MKKLIYGFMLFALMFALTSCGPALVEKFETIKPNETAFVISVEGATKSGQKQFMSVEFLNQAKVATKRIYLPQRKISTGRMWYAYSYIPTVDVIKVDRSPVTREWTADTKTGTTKSNQSLWVESKDSIGFGVGLNVTAMILEEDAAMFLYNYAGKSLSAIVDNNVRGRANAILSREFANHTLETGRDKKNEIIDKVERETVSYFKSMGVTISNVGLAEGLVYEDKEIQNKINENFTAEMDIQIKKNKRLSQAETNKMNIEVADADATAAQKFAKAAEERKKQIDIEISMMVAKARLTMAQKWDGKLPSNILPSDSSLIMDLTSAKK